MVEKERPEVWDILDEVIREHPVLLNRAPTLHRLGIQAFEPMLIEGKAIQLHPLVCAAFNADFDGDQMAVHVPLSVEAQVEARVLMMSTNNILSPANGTPDHRADAGHRARLLLHDARALAGARARACASPTPTRCASRTTRARSSCTPRSRCAWTARCVETTVGRVLLCEIVPGEIPFEIINKVMDKKALGELIDQAYRRLGNKATVILADRLRTLGYQHATARRHLDLHRRHDDPGRQGAHPRAARTSRSREIEEQYQEGLITDGERYNKVVDIWARGDRADRRRR